MQTKFAIAKKLSREGITTHIVNGKKEGALVAAFGGKAIGTKFLPQKKL